MMVLFNNDAESVYVRLCMDLYSRLMSKGLHVIYLVVSKWRQIIFVIFSALLRRLRTKGIFK